MHTKRPMRAAAVIVFLLLPGGASACPQSRDAIRSATSTDETPATASPCMRSVDFGAFRRSIELRYNVGGGGASQSSTGNTATAFAGLELGYGLQFGSDPAQPSYEVELSGAVAVQRIGGDISATGIATQAQGRLGPAQIDASVIDVGRNNLAFFPFTMELAHVGELSARPRISSRPEVARDLYHRERVAMATRLVRVEGAGEKVSTAAPGLTEPKKPSSWAFDFITLHSELDIALQSATRFETAIGGALMGVTDHTKGISLDILGIEHRRIDLTMAGPTDLDTVWVLRLDGTNPHTGTQYYMGWGEVIAMSDREELARRLDPENGSVSIGGFGWFSARDWGGFGAQYKREPFVTMTGASGLEDRFSAEVFVPRVFGLVMRTFAARTTRLVDDALQHDATAGVQVDASYTRNGLTSKLGLEAGRTFYNALDGGLPLTTGFAAGVGLTVQHTGGRTWAR